jgi:Flp pilus assembly secretin CpaC
MINCTGLFDTTANARSFAEAAAPQQGFRLMSIMQRATRTGLLAVGLAGATLWSAPLHAEAGAHVPAAVTSVGQRLAPVALLVDFAAVIQLEADIGAIVLGNSTIADATVTDGRMVVLTGKSAGVTNMIVLGVDNAIVAQVTLHVGGRKPGTVTVMRALKHQTYACEAGLCKDTAGPAPEALPTPVVAAVP